MRAEGGWKRLIEMVFKTVANICVAIICYTIGHVICNTLLDPSMNFFIGMLCGLVTGGLMEMIECITNTEN